MRYSRACLAGLRLAPSGGNCVASPSTLPEVIGTAAHLNVPNIFRMGGAQAIAAFAYGTRTVPRADRIVGPGNIYVAAAKKLKQPVTLKQIKDDPAFASWELVRFSRLSVMPVSDDIWEKIVEMSE